LTAAAVIFIFNIIPSVSANEKLADNKNYSWYFKPAKNNEQPSFDVNLADIKNYGAYAIGNKDEKVIYLTFDFGYENGNVKKCLDALNKNNVKGAFFILDNVIKTNPDLLKEMIETGHTVANHTMKHKNMCNIKDFDEYQKEIIGLEKLFEETTGHKLAKYYRPPKGEFTKQNLEYNQKLGYKTIFWSLAYKDWDENNQPDKTETINKILSRTHNGAVILLHPTSSTNAAILDKLIQEWKKAGYKFGTLDELTK
jgi:peptidoglycan-N-acetylmuramic acid deacetylase